MHRTHRERDQADANFYSAQDAIKKRIRRLELDVEHYQHLLSLAEQREQLLVDELHESKAENQRLRKDIAAPQGAPSVVPARWSRS